MKSDIEIAQDAELKPIKEIAESVALQNKIFIITVLIRQKLISIYIIS